MRRKGGFLESSPGVGTYIARSLASPETRAKKRRTASLPAQPAPPAAQPFNTVAAQFQPLPSAPFAVSIPLGAAAPGPIWRRLGNRLRAHGQGAPGGSVIISATLQAILNVIDFGSLQCAHPEIVRDLPAGGRQLADEPAIRADMNAGFVVALGSFVLVFGRRSIYPRWVRRAWPMRRARSPTTRSSTLAR